jgi:hypothetical protein
LFEPTPLNGSKNSMELLQVAQTSLSRLTKRLDDVDLFLIKLEMEEEEFVPFGLDVPFGKLGIDEDKDSKYQRSLFLELKCKSINL